MSINIRIILNNNNNNSNNKDKYTSDIEYFDENEAWIFMSNLVSSSEIVA